MSSGTLEQLSVAEAFAIEQGLRRQPGVEFGGQISAAAPLVQQVEPETEAIYRPGLIDAIHGIGRNPELLPFYARGGFFSLDRVLAFINQTGLSTGLLNTRDRVRGDYPFLFGPDWLVRFVGYFMGFTCKNIETESTWIPVSEVHCPSLAGCSTEFAFYSTSKSKVVFKVTAFGSSGGGGSTKTLTRVSSGRIEAASCQLQAKAELRLRLFENGAGERFYALDVIKIFDETRYVGIDVSDFYSIPVEQVLADANLHAVASDGALKELSEELTIETGRSHEFAWGTTVGKLLGGVTALLTVESEIVSGAKLTYRLVPKYRYVFCPVQQNSHVYLVLFQGT